MRSQGKAGYFAEDEKKQKYLVNKGNVYKLAKRDLHISHSDSHECPTSKNCKNLR